MSKLGKLYRHDRQTFKESVTEMVAEKNLLCDIGNQTQDRKLHRQGPPPLPLNLKLIFCNVQLNI